MNSSWVTEMIRLVLLSDRVKAIGRYETFVLVLVLVGIYSASHSETGTAWAIFAIITAGMAAPLTALWLRKKLATPRIKVPESEDNLPPKSTPPQIDVTPNAIL